MQSGVRGGGAGVDREYCGAKARGAPLQEPWQPMCGNKCREGSGGLKLREGGPAMERCETGSFKRGLTRQRAARLRGLSVLPRHALRVLGRLAGHERRGLLGPSSGLVS